MKPQAITKSGVAGIASRHGYRVEDTEVALYNLREDVGETRNVMAEYPEVVERLKQLARPMRAELGDALEKAAGSELRPLGKAE
jgi:hypothetical protein